MKFTEYSRGYAKKLIFLSFMDDEKFFKTVSDISDTPTEQLKFMCEWEPTSGGERSSSVRIVMFIMDILTLMEFKCFMLSEYQDIPVKQISKEIKKSVSAINFAIKISCRKIFYHIRFWKFLEEFDKNNSIPIPIHIFRYVVTKREFDSLISIAQKVSPDKYYDEWDLRVLEKLHPFQLYKLKGCGNVSRKNIEKLMFSFGLKYAPVPSELS